MSHLRQKLRSHRTECTPMRVKTEAAREEMEDLSLEPNPPPRKGRNRNECERARNLEER